MKTHLDNVSKDFIGILVLGLDRFELVAQAQAEGLELKVGVLEQIIVMLMTQTTQ
jgi:hypothetical protein